MTEEPPKRKSLSIWATRTEAWCIAVPPAPPAGALVLERFASFSVAKTMLPAWQTTYPKAQVMHLRTREGPSLSQQRYLKL